MGNSSPNSPGNPGQPVKPEVTPSNPDREVDEGDDGLCPYCGGDGMILASDGDGSDWGEDTYSGPDDAVIICRHCKGTGALL